MVKTRGTCPLCLEDTELIRSHVIPDATYRHLFDEKHRFLRISVSDERDIEEKLAQTGSWEHLLCRRCDVERLGPFDTYFALVWFEHPKLPSRLVGEGTVIIELEYTKFKLAHLASLFRAHHAKRGEWSRVDLGDDAETIRLLLLAESPGPDDFYSVSCVALRHRDGSAAMGALVPFFREPCDGPARIHAVYGGCRWLIQARGGPPEICLRPDGSMLVAYTEFEDDKIVRGLSKRVRKERALRGTKLRRR